MKVIILLLLLYITVTLTLRFQFKLNDYNYKQLLETYGGDLPSAAFDMIKELPTKDLTICFDNQINTDFLQLFKEKLLIYDQMSMRIFNLTFFDNQEKYFNFLNDQVNQYLDTTTIFFASPRLYEHILLQIYNRNLIRRNVIYIFSMGRKPWHRYFIRNVLNFIRIFVITNPRNNTLYYNQANSHKNHYLEMINWWKQDIGLFSHPTIPIKYSSIYKDFKGKNIKIPVIHKPPWHFVQYRNDNEIEVLGGRDDRILSVLSQKLNFKYTYFDPPERVQGLVVTENNTINGALGLVWKRDAELFIGDVALSLERSKFVEFSFITLTDSGAFITHAPSRLNEAVALIRPFQWQVWPAIGITFLIVGPVLYAIIALPNSWQPRFLVPSQIVLLSDCSWFTTTILLRQTGKCPSSSHKARFFIILLSICSTYVIHDIYSANLTSLLARPAREKAINTLEQLEKAMIEKGFKLFVEKQSSSLSLLQNGTGIYNRLWKMMNKKQANFLLNSVEDGVKLVKHTKTNAVLAGRETLYFDIQRFESSYFHLSEKLSIAYSAIAFQLGCPYIEQINRMYKQFSLNNRFLSVIICSLMALFETGVISKMTEYEYEQMGKQKFEQALKDSGKTAGADLSATLKKNTWKNVKGHQNEDNKLQPISIKMLQGAFYLLCIGNLFSGIILLLEIFYSKHEIDISRIKHRKYKFIVKTKNKLCHRIKYIINKIKITYRRFMNEAIIATLEYLE